MDKPLKTLPSNYSSSGSVSLKKSSDLTAMLIWSVALLVFSLFLVGGVLSILSSRQETPAFSFSIKAPVDLLVGLAGILLVTMVMVVVHEGLHGLVFWLITRERPKFAFKWYYASASAGDWYLPRLPYLAATLLPLIAITAAGLALLPFTSGFVRILLILLVVSNATGCAGDAVVAWRLYRLPRGTLSFDTGSEVQFYSPAQDAM